MAIFYCLLVQPTTGVCMFHLIQPTTVVHSPEPSCWFLHRRTHHYQLHLPWLQHTLKTGSYQHPWKVSSQFTRSAPFTYTYTYMLNFTPFLSLFEVVQKILLLYCHLLAVPSHAPVLIFPFLILMPLTPRNM